MIHKYKINLDCCLYAESCQMFGFGCHSVQYFSLQIDSKNGCCNFEDICESFYSSREFLKYISYPTLLLWLTEFFGWFVYVCVNIYFTDFVGEVIYGGSPTATDGELASLYSEGVRIASWFRAFEDILIFMYLLVLEWVSDYVGYRTLFLGGHIIQFLALFIAIFQHSIFTMFLLSFSFAIFTANLMSIPYALIPFYKVSRVLWCVTGTEVYIIYVMLHFNKCKLYVMCILCKSVSQSFQLSGIV